jgi:hypothetical protein
MKCKICKKDIFRDKQKHFVQLAKYEIWRKALEEIEETPHFDYYFKNTKPVKKGRTWKL